MANPAGERLDSFPTTVTGKVRKFAMREKMEREMKAETLRKGEPRA